MNDERKRFAESIADAIKDVRAFAVKAVADAHTALRTYVDDAVAAVGAAVRADMKQAQAEAARELGVANELLARHESLLAEMAVAQADTNKAVNEVRDLAVKAVAETHTALCAYVDDAVKVAEARAAHELEAANDSLVRHDDLLTQHEARLITAQTAITSVRVNADDARAAVTTQLAAASESLLRLGEECRAMRGALARELGDALAKHDEGVAARLSDGLAVSNARIAAVGNKVEQVEDASIAAATRLLASIERIDALMPVIERTSTNAVELEARVSVAEAALEAIADEALGKSAADADKSSAHEAARAALAADISAARADIDALTGSATGLPVRCEAVEAGLAALRASVAADARAASEALGAMEARVAGVESSVPEAAVLRASEAVSGAIAEARLSLAERFTALQHSVLAHLTTLKSGDPGLPGPPGRDGRMVPPVAWAPGHFRHGETVTHRGGLWSCYRETDAEPDAHVDSGWTLVINGMTDIALDSAPDDQRQVALVVRLASGETQRLELHVPSLLYRGVWRDDLVADEGDVVSHGGSAWIAKRRSIGSKPETAEAVDDWTLLVKRGKNGNVVTERAPRWRGPYTAGLEYETNDIVRTKNAIWLCIRKTVNPPSNASPLDWAPMLGAMD